jgi:hypothetical protein
MEENNLQNQATEFVPPPPPPEDISLTDAISGIFTEPGNTFTEVKSSSRKTYWLIPLIIFALITGLSSYIVLNDEELSSEIKKQQIESMRERFDQAVKEGKMTRDEANQQLEKSQKMFSGGMFVIFGLIGGIVSVFLFFFAKALVYLGVFKIFKGSAGYVNIMNVLGIASVIGSIQMIIDTVLAIFMGKMFVNLGPVLLFSQEQLGKQTYMFIANFDLLNIWYLIITSIGLAKISNIKTSVSVVIVFVLWLIWVVLTTFGPLNFMGR